MISGHIFNRRTFHKLLLLLFVFYLSQGNVFAINDDLSRLSDTYNYDFNFGVLNVTGFSDYMRDLNSNLVNDTLFVNLTVNLSSTGTYYFIVILDEQTDLIKNLSSTNVSPSNRVVEVSFSSNKLRKSRYNYSVEIRDINYSLVYRKFRTQTKSYGNYEQGTNVTSLSATNLVNSSIRVSFVLSVKVNETVNISSFLVYGNNSISSSQFFTLASPSQTIDLYFDNESIKSTHFFGNFSVTSLVIGTKTIPVKLNLSRTNFQDFAKTSYIKNVTILEIDNNSNNLTDTIKINFSLVLKSAGNFTIDSALYDSEDNLVKYFQKNVTYNASNQTVTIEIVGRELYQTYSTGVFKVPSARLLINNMTTDMIFETRELSSTSYLYFERPNLPDLIIDMNVTLNQTLANITLNITNIGTAPAFNVIVDLFNNNSYENQTSISLLNLNESVIINIQTANFSIDSIFMAIVDFSNFVDESNESNNIVSGEFIPFSSFEVSFASPNDPDFTFLNNTRNWTFINLNVNSLFIDTLMLNFNGTNLKIDDPTLLRRFKMNDYEDSSRNSLRFVEYSSSDYGKARTTHLYLNMNATDFSGNNNDFSFVGSPIWNSVDYITSNGSMNLSSGSDYLSRADDSDFEFDSNFSISFWFKMSSQDTIQGVYAKGGTSSMILQLIGNSAGDPLRRGHLELIDYGPTVDITLNSSVKVNDDQWHWALIQRDNTCMAMYIDNNLEVCSNYTGFDTIIGENADDIYIGNNGQGNICNKCSIDDFRVYKGTTLNDSERASIYNRSDFRPRNLCGLYPGKFGGGCLLNNSAYLNLSTENTFINGNSTICSWVKLGDNNTQQMIWWIGDRTANGWGTQAEYHLGFANTSMSTNVGLGYNLIYENGSANPGVESWVATGYAKPYVWTHLCAVANQSSLALFVNGLSVGSKAWRGRLNYSLINSGFLVGRPGSSERFLNGTIDELNIWNRSLGSTEIYQNYENEFGRFFVNITNIRDNTTNITYSAWKNTSLGKINTTENRTINFGYGSAPASPPPSPPSSPSNISFIFPSDINNTRTNNTRNWTFINLSVNVTSQTSLVSFNNSNITLDDNSTLLKLSFTNGYLNDSSRRNASAVNYNMSAWCRQSGYFGEGCRFNNSGNYRYLNYTDLDYLELTGDSGFCVWINPSSYGGSSLGRILDKKAGGSTGWTYRLGNTGTSPEIYFESNGNTRNSTGAHLHLGDWQQVCVNNNGSQVTFFVNLTYKGTHALSTATTANSNSIVLGIRGDLSRQFDGYIDEVELKNRPFTFKEMSDHYNYFKGRHFINLTNIKDNTTTFTYYGWVNDTIGKYQTETRTIKLGFS